MTDKPSLLDQAAQLLSVDQPALADVRRVVVELDDQINAPEFAALPEEDRARLQSAYKDLRALLRKQESPEAGATSAPGYDNGPLQSAAGQAAAQPRRQEREHNPYAEQQMEEAEKLFYGGRYAEAIKLYDQVLQVEADWERARQHRGESENYLRTGYIPSVALPAEAATAFGKAQSAARLGRYQDAMALLTRAQNILREMGIQRWQEGQDFEQKLQQNIDAESVYAEGVQLFSQGMLEEGIDRVETAARATGLPRYADKATEMRKVRDTVQRITELLNGANPEVKAVAQAKVELDGLLVQYEHNTTLLKLRGRIEATAPRVIEPLKEQIRALKVQADRSQTLDGALQKARQARQALDQARSLGYIDDEMDKLSGDIERSLREVQRYQDELQQATTVLNTNRSWPVNAARISQEVRSRYPNDPEVAELTRGLAPYRNTITGFKIAGGVVGLALVILLLVFAAGRVRAFVVSLTPTPTATPTRTATLAPTATPEPTLTNTPEPSVTPAPTATPLSGKVGSREIWARNGCYEGFTAIGRVPAEGLVKFLPSERRFDTYNRECVLVEYRGETNSVIGWILIADLAQ
jgi:tetratricopeptide (TPR) repeat protein